MSWAVACQAPVNSEGCEGYMESDKGGLSF